MPAYPYMPFLESAEEIRLLTVEAGEYDDIIRCGLANVSLHKQPSYEALSYVWKSCSSLTPPPLDEELTVAKAGEDGTTIEEMRFGDLPDRWEYVNLYHSAGGHYRNGIMVCDGIEITIGGELYMALKRLRFAGSDRVLWVDAVCINQDDLEERKLHVQFMGQIYTKAKKVLVWLGELHGLDSRAFETFQAIPTVLPELHTAPKYKSRRELFLQNEKVRNMHWDQLSPLLRRSWFQRVWVIQEISSATDAEVFIGNISYDWNLFAAIITSLRGYDIDFYLEGDGWPVATRSVPLMMSLRKMSEQDARLPLLEILVRSRHFKCTLHHDKIYGILQLASDANQNYVNIDYTIDASRIYTDFTVSHISKCNSLNILYACTRSGGTSDLTLPSWVPDWTQPCHHSPFFSIELPSNAAGASEIQLRFEDDNTSLFIHGKLVDTIHTVEELRRIPRVRDSSHSSSRTRIWDSKHMENFAYSGRKSHEWILNAMQIAFPDQTCTPEMYEALWRTWICNSTHEGTRPPPSWGERFSRYIQSQTVPPDDKAAQQGFLREWSRQNRDRYDLRLTVEDEDPHMHEIAKVDDFNSCSGRWCFNRRFFRTVAGRFGWAPDKARPGDRICVFYGGDYPFVLREGEDGGGCHEIIGDGYLHGFMDGEAMDCTLEEREFHLV